MGQLVLWACFLAVLAGIGLAAAVAVRDVRRLVRERADRPAPAPAAAAPAEVAPRRMVLTIAERPNVQASLPPPRSGRGLAYLLPSPQASTG